VIVNLAWRIVHDFIRRIQTSDFLISCYFLRLSIVPAYSDGLAKRNCVSYTFAMIRPSKSTSYSMSRVSAFGMTRTTIPRRMYSGTILSTSRQLVSNLKRGERPETVVSNCPALEPDLKTVPPARSQGQTISHLVPPMCR